ncbi:hypothetical protein LZP73_18935 [Shewanella sp. AS16]|uniref:hypothetical protein n=1 Tax=Shewanella sp. AS16 TaxID=2907625 RepID=UPI001F346948|nr:hypothetical protein [Shewanella sp. AS16]MCE9688249.1 hypothetical protein [Shewanella sp. AS16]
MFKKNLALAICLGLSLTANTTFAADETEGKVASFGEQILDKAKDKFISAAGGHIASLFFDAIFGTSSGPSYVNLTEASLQAIQDRVHIEFVDTAEYQYYADLESLELSVHYYSDTAQNGNPDVNVLGSLLVNSNDLLTHYSLNSQFNDKYYYLADSFALAASLSMAIYVERNIQGYISSSSVQAKANQLANQLQSLLDAKKNADLPLRDECEITTSRYEQYEEELCLFKDPHGNILGHRIFDTSVYHEEDMDEWEVDKEIMERDYYAGRFGEIEDVIYKLRSF